VRSRYYYQRKRDKKYIPTLVWCDSNWKLFSFRFFQSIIGFCKNKIGSFHFNLSSKWVYGERGFLATCNAFAAFVIQTWLSLFLRRSTGNCPEWRHFWTCFSDCAQDHPFPLFTSVLTYLSAGFFHQYIRGPRQFKLFF